MLKECELRSENGNCLMIGGFCTSVPQNYCYMAKKLKKYEDLERQGMLLKLPCAVGNTVYCIRKSWSGYVIDKKKFRVGMADKIGKSVFCEEKEAEAALKELKLRETRK